MLESSEHKTTDRSSTIRSTVNDPTTRSACRRKLSSFQHDFTNNDKININIILDFSVLNSIL